MEPRTAKARLKTIAMLLRDPKAHMDQRRIGAHWCEEIIKTIEGMDIADGDLAKVIHRARWAR